MKGAREFRSFMIGELLEEPNLGSVGDLSWVNPIVRNAPSGAILWSKATPARRDYLRGPRPTQSATCDQPWRSVEGRRQGRQLRKPGFRAQQRTPCWRRCARGASKAKTSLTERVRPRAGGCARCARDLPRPRQPCLHTLPTAQSPSTCASRPALTCRAPPEIRSLPSTSAQNRRDQRRLSNSEAYRNARG